MSTIVSCFLLSASLFAQSAFKIHVRVIDDEGKPISYVNVFFKDGDFAGAISNDSGIAVIQTKSQGDRILVGSLIGYDPFEKKIKIPFAGPVLMKLSEKSVALGELRIEASSYSGGEGKVAVTNLDVYTTPGGAADIFQSIKVLPGVTQTDETAALPIRGGSPAENIILFNGATLAHPYHGENTSGNGLFSVVETAVMKKLYFSSGGFSVKYGNALSGVLDIETENRITTNRVKLDANLVNVGGGIQRELVKNKVALQVYGKHTSTNLLYRLNKPTFDIVKDPESTTLTAIVNYTYSATGQFQGLLLYSGDAQKFDLVIQSNSSRYQLKSFNHVGSVVWSDVIAKKWVTKSSLTYSAYQNDWQFDRWNKDNRETNYKWKWDNNYEVSGKTIVSFGSETYNDVYQLDFLLPKRRGEFYRGADSVKIRGRNNSWVLGNYVELQQRLSRRWSLMTGLRHDYHQLSRDQIIDVRGAIVHELSENTFLRLAGGTFHQFSNIVLYDKKTGNPGLEAMKAKHLVVGFEKNGKTNQLKIESYYKWYSQLPLEDAVKNYTSSGEGYARGIDVFLKGSLGRTSGWVSYSFIQTRRKELNISTLRPSIYDITHNLSLINKHNLGNNFELASTLRLASGRPFTPIVAGQYNSISENWSPVYAAKNSARFPIFKRLDARLSKLIFFGPQRWVVFYVEALNLFGNDSVLDYSYSEDFSERNPIKSYFSNRTVVMGFSLNY